MLIAAIAVEGFHGVRELNPQPGKWMTVLRKYSAILIRKMEASKRRIPIAGHMDLMLHRMECFHADHDQSNLRLQVCPAVIRPDQGRLMKQKQEED
ncbi:hypothetical protein Q8A64_09140 [Oxalobacteraceae bacterium R-40]|uniref:Uncharacterized protein n=1 Tax=Keguizhuia sedimenti TaxID=3064264 RepID=A0ABU1BNK3_9BURK|nr:hypothetical protein [Oxalobacteraceae bacterium R-40]